jgi:hypothetical protein
LRGVSGRIASPEISETAIIAVAMTLMNPLRMPSLYAVALFAVICCCPSHAQTATPAQSAPKYPNYSSETPNELKPATASFDHERHEVMIPMRDGVKLHTVILVPKSATNAMPSSVRSLWPKPMNDGQCFCAVQGGYIKNEFLGVLRRTCMAYRGDRCLVIVN